MNKKYKIEVRNVGHVAGLANPLRKIDGYAYDTREDACERIYDALSDVIDGDTGCEMVERAPAEYGSLYVCDKHGNNAEPLELGADPYDRDDVLTIDVDPDGEGLALRETTVDDDCDLDVDYVTIDAAGTVLCYYKWVTGYDCKALEMYEQRCRDYIMCEGYAREDGIVAEVVEIDDERA